MSDFLYAPGSFFEGVSRILDLGGTLVEFNQSPDESTADFLAIREDWRAVGNDLRLAVAAVKRERAGAS